MNYNRIQEQDMSSSKLPQHQNKCYCQKGCPCNFDYMKKKIKTNFVKTNSLQKSLYSPEIEMKSIPKKVPSSEISSFTTRRKFYEFQKFNEFNSYDEIQKAVKPKSLYDFSKVEEMSKFRSENSQDCISLSNKLSHDRLMRIRKERNQSSSGHVCSHRFFLNERLFPEATLKNEMGDSLCTLCRKPCDPILDIKMNPLNVEKKVLSKCSEESSLNLQHSSSNPTLILEVKEDKFGKSEPISNWKKGSRLTELNNSLALRYQRY